MTRERAKELLPIIQAFAEGKTIQMKNCYPNCAWIDHEEPCWIDKYEYRIKPELREGYVLSGAFHETIESATACQALCLPFTKEVNIVHVREII